jgi:hypothetical protein
MRCFVRGEAMVATARAREKGEEEHAPSSMLRRHPCIDEVPNEVNGPAPHDDVASVAGSDNYAPI